MTGRHGGNQGGRPRLGNIPVAVRLWWRVEVGGPDDCWLWTGATNGRGYGKIGDRSGDRQRFLYVHRVAWEDKVGCIPEGMTVDHLCATQLCCNPSHLELVTAAENSRRAAVRRWERYWMRELKNFDPDST